ncbi:hypothetical protein [Actinoplanes friuliensis]|uniref:Uncharacterized protein n=1 Tax=Actinoplanes friuliensis DSM 7358 TaxID=1246995 RepID=U5W5D8_9ACTN|nr:hypothetical protein [Actinoplanes friuliensis]AGZ44428.1 hypothetical protein AFR_30840 [Actinoplanes friuliensis DSM 7358]
MSSLDEETDLARVADSLRNDVRRKIGALRTQIYEEIHRVGRVAEQRSCQLAARIDTTDERLGGIAGAQDDLRRQTGDEMRGTRQAIARLTGEIHLIEGRLRLEHGVVPVDLDEIPAGLAPLVAQVREAEDIRSSLLDDKTRQDHEQTVSAYAELESAVAESRTRALEASRTLATAKAGGRAFRKAAVVYRRERALLRARTEELRTTRVDRDASQAELAQDVRRRQSYRSHRGATAIDELTDHLRDRIDAAVAAHALFPAWFTITELGHRPPAARAALWREVAVEVLLYRLTHQVRHGVLALGPPPGSGDPLAERHAAVLASLARLSD